MRLLFIRYVYCLWQAPHRPQPSPAGHFKCWLFRTYHVFDVEPSMRIKYILPFCKSSRLTSDHTFAHRQIGVPSKNTTVCEKLMPSTLIFCLTHRIVDGTRCAMCSGRQSADYLIKLLHIFTQQCLRCRKRRAVLFVLHLTNQSFCASALHPLAEIVSLIAKYKSKL